MSATVGVPDIGWFFYLALAIVGVSAGVAAFFITRWLIAVFTNPHAALAIEEKVHYDTKGAAASRMLVIRGVDDEAALSLAAGSIGSRLSYLVLVGVIPAIYAISAFLAALSSLLIPFDSDSGSWIGFLMLGSFFGALIFFFVPGAFKSVFGREFLVNALVCDIAVDSGPDTLGQVEAITLRPVEAAPSKQEECQKPSDRPFSLRRLSEMMRIWLWEFATISRQDNKSSWQLRHGIYSHPDCVDEIVRWLRRVT